MTHGGEMADLSRSEKTVTKQNMYFEPNIYSLRNFWPHIL